jgi:hypothetical protein
MVHCGDNLTVLGRPAGQQTTLRAKVAYIIVNILKRNLAFALCFDTNETVVKLNTN